VAFFLDIILQYFAFFISIFLIILLAPERGRLFPFPVKIWSIQADPSPMLPPKLLYAVFLLLQMLGQIGKQVLT
jgi:hypothetical protein